MADAGRWAIVTAEGEAGIAVFRVLMEQPEDASAYPVNVCVSYPYEGDSSGLPTASSQAALDRFENTITDLMWPPGPSRLVFTVSGFNVREWQFQATSFGDFIARFNELQAGQPRLPLDIQYSDDPGWTLWHSVRDRAVKEEPS